MESIQLTSEIKMATGEIRYDLSHDSNHELFMHCLQRNKTLLAIKQYITYLY